jgi:hypothetical protein
MSLSDAPLLLAHIKRHWQDFGEDVREAGAVGHLDASGPRAPAGRGEEGSHAPVVSRNREASPRTGENVPSGLLGSGVGS